MPGTCAQGISKSIKYLPVRPIFEMPRQSYRAGNPKKQVPGSIFALDMMFCNIN